MTTPTIKSVQAVNPTTTQTPIGSGNAEADAAAALAKKSLAKETTTSSILTSGAGVLDNNNLKKNLLG